MSDEVAEFADHARWLIEWHNRRSEAMATRAAALLGFVGVILALILNGSRDVEPTGLVLVVFSAAVLSLGVSAVAALLALRPRSVGMPSPVKFREWWSIYAEQPDEAPDPEPMVADSLIRAKGTKKESPVVSASKEASDRARHFEVSAWALLISLVPLTVLVSTVLFQTRGVS